MRKYINASFYFVGSKESFNEPKNLTQKVREILRKADESSESVKSSESAKPEEKEKDSGKKGPKEDDSESVKQRDKV